MIEKMESFSLEKGELEMTSGVSRKVHLSFTALEKASGSMDRSK